MSEAANQHMDPSSNYPSRGAAQLHTSMPDAGQNIDQVAFTALTMYIWQAGALATVGPQHCLLSEHISKIQTVSADLVNTG